MANKKVNVEVKYKVKGAEGVEGAFDDVAESANEAAAATGGLNQGVGGLKGAFGAAKQGIGGLLQGFKAVVANPIGAVITAVVVAVQALQKAFANNEEATNKLQQGFAYLKGLLKPLEQAFFAVFDAIVFAIEKPGEAWDNVVAAFEAGFEYWKTVIFEPFLAIWGSAILGIEKGLLKVRIAWNEFTGDSEEAAKLTERLDEVNQKLSDNADTLINAGKTVVNTMVAVGETIAEVVEEANEYGNALADITRREQELTKARRAQEIQNAKSLAQLEELKVIRDDESKSYEERIQANRRIAEIEANRINQALNLTSQELEILKERARLEGEGTEILDKITEKEQELAELRNENAGIRAEQITNENALRREQFEEEATRIDRQLELDTKLEENAVKIADAIVRAEELKLQRLRELGVKEQKLIEEQEFNITNAKLEAQKARMDSEKEQFKEEAARIDRQLKLDTKLEKNAVKVADAIVRAEELKLERLRELGIKDQKLIEEQELKITDAKINAQKARNKREEEQEKQFQQNRADIISGGFELANTFAREGSKEAAAIQKASALTQIAIDTAQAYSSLTSASNKNPLNGLTGGLAGIAQFTAGAIRIATNIGKAYQLLKAPAPDINPDSTGGGTTSASAPAPQLDNIDGLGVSAGSERFGANIPMKAYVVESDITTSQRNISNIENLSQLQ